jgi:hypothetical protein
MVYYFLLFLIPVLSFSFFISVIDAYFYPIPAITILINVLIIVRINVGFNLFIP